MKTLILLDDERTLKDITWVNYPQYKKVIHFKFFEEFTNFCDNIFGGSVSHLNFNNLDFSFDHDIQSFDKYGNEWTGYSCLKYLLDTTYLIDLESLIYTKEENNINNSTFFFHTKNPVGKENMEKYYQHFMKFINEN